MSWNSLLFRLNILNTGYKAKHLYYGLCKINRYMEPIHQLYRNPIRGVERKWRHSSASDWLRAWQGGRWLAGGRHLGSWCSWRHLVTTGSPKTRPSQGQAPGGSGQGPHGMIPQFGALGGFQGCRTQPQGRLWCGISPLVSDGSGVWSKCGSFHHSCSKQVFVRRWIDLWHLSRCQIKSWSVVVKPSR